jgi:hydrogenase maturation protease
MDREGRILVYGYGNPGRVDDGLGPALASALEGSVPAGVRVDSNYQLALEDAMAVATHEVVLFVDAAASGPAPFSLARVATDRRGPHFTTHSVSPGELLAVAEQLSKEPAVAFVLGIRGYEWGEFAERLSAVAEKNLETAVRFVREGLTLTVGGPDFAAYLERHVTQPLPLTDIDVRPGA